MERMKRRVTWFEWSSRVREGAEALTRCASDVKFVGVELKAWSWGTWTLMKISRIPEPSRSLPAENWIEIETWRFGIDWISFNCDLVLEICWQFSEFWLILFENDEILTQKLLSRGEFNSFELFFFEIFSQIIAYDATCPRQFLSFSFFEFFEIFDLSFLRQLCYGTFFVHNFNNFSTSPKI